MTGKEIAAEKAVELIEEGMTVGLGSGSTAEFAIRKIGEKVKQGLKIKAVATSRKSEDLAKKLSIPVVDPAATEVIDIAIDGADEVDRKGNLIKGGGGSLLREKVIAFASQRFYVIVDDSKLVERLGKRSIPVEMIAFAADLTLRHIKNLGGDAVLRQSKGKNFITDNGNLIADCNFNDFGDPAWLDVKLKMIPGVVETGLFLSGIVTGIFVGSASNTVHFIPVNS